MKMRHCYVMISLCFVMVVISAIASEEKASFDLEVPSAPRSVMVDGRQQLSYELHLSNVAQRDLDPARLEVVDLASGESLAIFDGEKLERRLDRSGEQSGAEGFTIPAGKRGVIFLDLSMHARRTFAKGLTHRLHYHADDGTVARVEGGNVGVVRRGGASAVSTGWWRPLGRDL